MGRDEARRIWKILHCNNLDSTLEAPSKLYTIPLYPLLSHSNTNISNISSLSFAYAMLMTEHIDSMENNILKLCEKYIEHFPVFNNNKVDNNTSMKKSTTTSLSSTTKKKSSSSIL